MKSRQLHLLCTAVLELKHTGGAGERAGEQYDRASYVTSLTTMQHRGLPALPAAPQA